MQLWNKVFYVFYPGVKICLLLYKLFIYKMHILTYNNELYFLFCFLKLITKKTCRLRRIRKQQYLLTLKMTLSVIFFFIKSIIYADFPIFRNLLLRLRFVLGQLCLGSGAYDALCLECVLVSVFFLRVSILLVLLCSTRSLICFSGKFCVS